MEKVFKVGVDDGVRPVGSDPTVPSDGGRTRGV